MYLSRRSGLPREMSSLLENFFDTQREDNSIIETSDWTPSVDLKEEENRFLVKADLPGMKSEDIEVCLEQNILTIKGKREEEKVDKQSGYTRIERASGSFYRRFYLPDTADGDKIDANYTKGVLEVSIPKKASSKPQKIEIKHQD